MATSYKTPKRGQGKENVHRQGGSGGKVKAVDVVTGKTKIEYFFDPSLVLPGESSQETPFKGAPSTPATPFRREGSSSSALGGGDNNDPLLFSSKHLFMPCTIIKALDADSDSSNGQPIAGPTLVKTSDGTLHKISDSTKLIPVTSPDDYLGIEDVLHLPNVSEASLVNTLRLRYRRDDIYTSAGPILLSINPYKKIAFPNGESLYSEQQMMQYRNKHEYEEELPPHLFQVADRAYTALMQSVEPVDLPHEEDAALQLEHYVPPGTVRNQSIIISGESGAGKTEATKYIMQFLARITKKPNAAEAILSPDGRMIAALEDRVLSSNPLLETFGNARTLRNDNSSRFGKFIHIYFSTETGTITGAAISNYLLEKTRITHQIEGERNYHIFYQLLAGGNDELLAELGLSGGTSSFQYLMGREVSKSRRDTNGFTETMECLSRIGLAEADKRKVFGIAAAVLHLGNIKFQEQGEGEDGEAENAKITDESRPSLTKACELLGLDEEKVSEAILTKLLTIGGKTIHKAQNVPQAEDKRDAFAKLTYSCLFLWLVKRVNETLKSQEAQDDDSADGFVKAAGSEIETGFIGVLDIYGFEVFETNGYEQLLINYCNEKLQRHFNRHLFEVEQDLYASEGVDWTYITFNDNRPCLELIEGGIGSVGILNTLDDAWGGMGTAAEKDVKFVSHLHSLFGSPDPKSSKKGKQSDEDKGHKYYVMPKFGNDRQFIIIHYAGDVRYTANGFVEKNMESLSNELKDLGAQSSIPLTQKVYFCGSTTEEDLSPTAAASRRSSIRGVSVASQFRLSLQALVEDLECTQPHYVRCIKPNLGKAPNNLDSGEVLRQLRYSGMMEAIRIRREGYALREDHESFYNRFSVLLRREDFGEEAGIEQLVSSLSKRLSVTDADWQIGHSKVFLRRELADKLERLAKLKVHVAARTVSRFGRFVAQRRAASVLTSWGRFRLHMLEFYRRHHATSKIIAAYRRYKQASRFATMRSVAVFIQSQQRRKIAVERVRHIRDPYVDMSYRDMKKLYKTEQARLDEAVSSKNFAVAAEIESLLATVKETMEAKKPFTRSMLEAQIEETQKSLDDALARKAYQECEPLQAKLEELKGRRDELPTIEELKEDLSNAEAEVAAAAQRRDFPAAAASQMRIDEAKKRLEEAIAAENADVESDDEECGAEKESSHGIASRADLEKEISSLNQQIKSAISSKDFQTATALQITLEQREKLRSLFPTVMELKEQLSEVKGKMEKALAKKDFIKAGDFDKQVAELESKLAAEIERVGDGSSGENGPDARAVITGPDGEEQVFESRFELEQEIALSTKQVEEAVANKEFKKAEALQARVDSLHNLRRLLPSVTELGSLIREKKSAMEKAIREKKFAAAEDINGEIEKLEEKLRAERSKVESRVSPQKDGDVDSVRSTPVIRNRAPLVAKATSVSEGVKPRRLNAKPPSQIGVRVANDEMSEVSSVNSLSKGFGSKSKRQGQQLNSLHESVGERPVSKLRPKKPLLSALDDSIVSMTQMLANKRADASLVVGADGGLAGIITDTDITRRVVAKNMDPATTSVSVAMTPNPTCVRTTDSAMDALQTMVENHFRHLPVVDDQGSIVGLLDIAKCLNDAISKLERSTEKSSSSVEDAVKQVAGLQGAAGAQVAALQALLGPLMAQAFGNQTSPTLRSLLAGKPATIVGPETSLRDAGILMAERRKAALVVEDGELKGIFGFKDMMSRAVAKELSLDRTAISAVMTPDPEFVSPEMTVLEALQTMHENKFLTLPVCESDGTVVGLVDVMDVIYGCGGAEGWRSIFSSVMGIDEASDTSSVYSAGERSYAVRSTRSARSSTKKDERPVSKLRPKKPLLSSTNDSILSVTQMLANKRGDASLVTSADGTLAGIITDTDITRRVVAKHIDPEATAVSVSMTPNPTCVSMTDSAMDALQTMVENHFRHLPVVDQTGAVVGLLDIAKCLNDAISKLEKAQIKDSEAAKDAVKQVAGLHGAGEEQAAALQALLGPLLSQTFGNKSSPTLRSLLAGKPATVVAPGTSLRDAGMLMAERRKAALIVDDGNLVGIFGFKDMMFRAVAKELPLEDTPVSAVMTPDPEAVSPDMTVLEALQTMHDNKFLTLPVCEADGSVVGLVDVMDLIYGCGGTEGWRSVFSRAMELDDASDASSVYSHDGGGGSRSGRSTGSARSAAKDLRPVSKLRPKKPFLSSVNDSILSMTQMLANKRGDASLITTPNGSLAGIITDTDITRRVVAKDVDPASATVSVAMTPDPTCVSMSDSAMDALQTMVENHFRHLPVLDDDGAVVGLLDIAKCLNDAISKLEYAQEKNSKTAEDAVKQVAGLQGAGGAQAAVLQALLRPLMAQAFGNQTSPTLRSILAGRPSTIVSPSASLKETGRLMAERRKAALVVENGNLVGIFGFKDMMIRAVAKELPLDDTPVSAVMTANPESVLPDVTVLEALQTMHDHGFLTLPVCEENGNVVGIVDVMDLIHGCGGAEGWRSIFSQAIDLEDLSETNSVFSREKSVNSARISNRCSVKARQDARPVSKLRPKTPLMSLASDSILAMTQMLAKKRGDACIVVDDTGMLAGIITDTDITRRVVAKHVDPETSAVSVAMTPNPTCVSMTDSAMDALQTMVENHFRHLPVVGDDGSVVGLLDIAKCLNDAISKLERAQEKTSKTAEEAVKQVAGVGGAQAAALQALLGPLMAQAFGNQASPTLRSLLAGKPATIVGPDTTLRDAGLLMAERRKAALVVADGELVGIFGFKDMMTRAVAKELSLDETVVSTVMTPEPEAVPPDMTVLEGLQVMHDHGFLTLPVCEDDGRVVGLVDVMDLIYGCGGAEGWRSVFDNAMDLEDDSASEQLSNIIRPSDPVVKVAPDSAFFPNLPNNIPTQIEVGEGVSSEQGSVTESYITDGRGFSTVESPSMLGKSAVFKLTDPSGHTHRIRSELRKSTLLKKLIKKMGDEGIDPDNIRMKFVDDEGDAVMITDDECLAEAARLAKDAGSDLVKLSVTIVKPKSADMQKTIMMAGGGVAVALAAATAILLLKSKRG